MDIKPVPTVFVVFLQAGFVLPPPSTVSSPAASSSLSKPVNQTTPVIRPWIPPPPQTEPKPSTRDPRLNRTGPLAAKKESPLVTPDRKPLDKSTRQDKTRPPRKEVLEEKDKSKSPSLLNRSVQKPRSVEAEPQRLAEDPKKDPRLKKRLQDKTSETREDEIKDKKRCSDKERDEALRGPEPQRTAKSRLVNGSVAKQDRGESADKADFKTGGNARTHARKRSRSRSPTASPKRKDRRSPKGRPRSTSPSHKPGKPRRVRVDDMQHSKLGRDRLALKKTQSEGRRPKRPAEDHRSESRDSPRGHDGGVKELKEVPQRWRSGWEENKQ